MILLNILKKNISKFFYALGAISLLVISVILFNHKMSEDTFKKLDKHVKEKDKEIKEIKAKKVAEVKEIIKKHKKELKKIAIGEKASKTDNRNHAKLLKKINKLQKGL